MIRVEHLTKRYGRVVVVDDLSFDVAAGEAVALWGPNGAGKSTVVHCLMGLARFDGRIEVDGLDVRRAGKAVRSRIGHVPQELAFSPHLGVHETVAYSAALRRAGAEAVERAIETVGMTDERGKLVGALSGGMKQRLAIAIALLHDPAVLVLDEPTSNLDVASREAMVALLEELRDRRRSILLTSHHLEEVGMLVDRVLALEDGRLRLECEPDLLAERLGLRSWLHLTLGSDETAAAIDVLTASGFAARANARGVLVEVAAQQKGEALGVLHAAGLEVLDLEVWR